MVVAQLIERVLSRWCQRVTQGFVGWKLAAAAAGGRL